jgi:energy-coupling factor transport system ATP-binding protein
VGGLTDLNLSVSAQQRVVLLGANGSGKSTLALLANGLLLPKQGEVRVDGLLTHNCKTITELRSRVGLVMQDADNQIVSTSVFEEVAFGPQNLGWSRERIYASVADALAAVGFDAAMARRDPNTLSGGEKQRLILAAALSMAPRYLVLDEPTAMLDARSRQEVLHCIDVAQGRGCGILLITHDLFEAATADLVVIMDRGRVVRRGSPSELLADRPMLEYYGLICEPADISCDTTDSTDPAPARTYAAGAPLPSENSGAPSAVSPEHSGEPSAVSSEYTGVAQGGNPRRLRNRVCLRHRDHGTRLHNQNDLTLELRNVGFTYASDTDYAHSVLSGIDFSLAQGQCALLVGASGAGKSTLLRIAAGLLAPSKGSVVLRAPRASRRPHQTQNSHGDQAVQDYLSGWDIPPSQSRRSRKAGQSAPTVHTAQVVQSDHAAQAAQSNQAAHAVQPGQVALVFQQPESQLFASTLAEDIIFGPKNLGLISGPEQQKQIIDRSLLAVGLTPERFAQRSPFSLSGGEARRAAIATTLALEAPFLLLDEPSAGLDARGRAFVYELLARLVRQGTGVLIATHDPDYFWRLATDCYELCICDGCGPAFLQRLPLSHQEQRISKENLQEQNTSQEDLRKQETLTGDGTQPLFQEQSFENKETQTLTQGLYWPAGVSRGSPPDLFQAGEEN